MGRVQLTATCTDSVSAATKLWFLDSSFARRWLAVHDVEGRRPPRCGNAYNTVGNEFGCRMAFQRNESSNSSGTTLPLASTFGKFNWIDDLSFGCKILEVAAHFLGTYRSTSSPLTFFMDFMFPERNSLLTCMFIFFFLKCPH